MSNSKFMKESPFLIYPDFEVILVLEKNKKPKNQNESYTNKYQDLVIIACSYGYKLKCFNTTKCWVCDGDYVERDVKVKYHCRITKKYRGSAHRYYDINVKLTHKIPS